MIKRIINSVFITGVFLAGCAGQHKIQTDKLVIESTFGSACELVGQHCVVGRSVENRRIECLVKGKGKDVVFIMASIHGNESVGTPLVLQFAEYLQEHVHLLDGRKVLLLPVANPDGVFYNSRFNAHGIDLNRNFQAANRRNNAQFGYKALSEPESRFVEQLIRQYSPARIVSIHQPLSCIDYDGPGEALAKRIAHHCNLPIKKLGAKPGSLGSYAGETLGIPIITIELADRHGGFNSEQLWKRYGPALVEAVVYPDKINKKVTL